MEPENSKTVYLMGVFVLIGGLILAALVIRFGSLSEVWRSRYELSIMFKNSSTLMQGSPVRLGGQRIGEVAKPPELQKDLSGVKVTTALEDSFQLPEGSTFRIATSGVMGDAFIQVVPPEEATDSYIQAGTVVEGAAPVDLMASADSIAQKTNVLMEEIRGGVKDLTTAVNRINSGILGDENLDNFNKMLGEAKTAVENFNTGYLNQENADAVRSTLVGFRDTAMSAQTQVEKIGKMVDDLGPAVKDAKAALGEAKSTFQAATSAIKKVDSIAGEMRETGNTIASLRKSFDALRETLVTFHSGPGLLSALMRDEKLKADFKALISNMKEKGVLFYRDISDKDTSNSRGPANRAQPPRMFYR